MWAENELIQLDKNLIWVDWVKQFSDRINTNIKSTKNKREFLRGLLESMDVKSVMGSDMDFLLKFHNQDRPAYTLRNS